MARISVDRRPVHVLAALAALACIGGTPERASAGWQEPFAVSAEGDPATFGEGPVAAAAPDGSFLVAWFRTLPDLPTTHLHAVEARWVGPDGEPGPLLTLTPEPGDASTVRVAIGPDGGALAIWHRSLPDEGAVLEGRRIGADGSLGPLVAISEPEELPRSASLAIDSAGDATVAWNSKQGDSAVLRVRRLPAAGPPGEVFTLTRTIDGVTDEQAVAVGPDRRPLVVYDQFGRVKAQRLSAEGEPIPGVVQLSAEDDTSAWVQAGMDAGGTARVTWGRIDPNPLLVSTRTVAPDGTLGPTQVVADRRSSEPVQAVSPDGGAALAWQDTPKEGAASVEGAQILPDGTVGPELGLSPPSANFGMDPRIGTDSRATSTVVWQRNLGGGWAVEAGRFSTAGRLGGVVTLSDPTDIGPEPDVAVQPAGSALAAWVQETPDGETARFKAARFLPPPTPPTPPTPPDPPGPPDPPAPRYACHGEDATIVGTGHDNDIVGTPGRDIIDGGAGDDTIKGLGGDDLICGRDGDDEIRGNRGGDRVYAGDGSDEVVGGRGGDGLRGQGDDDEVLSRRGADLSRGGSGEDDVSGGRGEDDLGGGDADDAVFGGPQDDFLNGGRGDNLCRGGHGANVLVRCQR